VFLFASMSQQYNKAAAGAAAGAYAHGLRYECAYTHLLTLLFMAC